MPVWVYVGEEVVASSIPTLNLRGWDRRNHLITNPSVTWAFTGDVDVAGDTIRPSREAEGWLIASAAASRDSVELWALDDLGPLGTQWASERWVRYHDDFVRGPGTLGFHHACDGDPLDDLYQPDDWIDSTRSSSSFPSATYSRVQPGLLLGFGTLTLTVWCSSGVVIVENADDAAMTTMLNHEPFRLGGLPADPATRGYALFEGSADSPPYLTEETRLRPGRVSVGHDARRGRQYAGGGT